MKALTSIRWTKPDYDWPQQAIYQRLQMAALIALLTMCAFFLLLTLKAFDDNRLTSWQWVFVDARAWWVCLLMLPALALAWFGAGLRVPRPYKVTLLFLSAFAAGMLFWNEPEVIVDTSRYFSQAKYLAVYGVAEFSQAWGQEVTAWTDLPLVPFIYGLTFTLLGESRAGIQLVTTLFFAGTVTLTYLLGRAVWDETVGFYGGALLLGMPYLLTQVPLMLVDIPTMFFLTLAVYVTWQAIMRGTLPLLLLAAVTITLALLAKYSTWLMLSVVLHIDGSGAGMEIRCHHRATQFVDALSGVRPGKMGRILRLYFFVPNPPDCQHRRRMFDHYRSPSAGPSIPDHRLDVAADCFV
ncbi:MAG: glycosyltransferase family 39 protein [Desulfuromonadales bacterium]